MVYFVFSSGCEEIVNVLLKKLPVIRWLLLLGIVIKLWFWSNVFRLPSNIFMLSFVVRAIRYLPFQLPLLRVAVTLLNFV